MIDAERVLRPLRDEAASIERLRTYRSPEELSAALLAAWRGAEHTLRLLLRSEPAAPDDARMAAMSTAELPFDRLIAALRRSDLVSIGLAGRLHELEKVVARVSSGAEARPADADAGLETIEQLDAEVRRRQPAPAPVAAPVMEAMVPEPEPVVPGTGIAIRVGIAVVLVVLAGAAVVFLRGDGVADIRPGVEAFRAGDMSRALAHFEAVAGSDSTNVTALLYLGRIHRREGRYAHAATALRTAAARDSTDADVRRELGWLFMDLNRPESAVEQFDIARRADPENAASWVGLVKALRAAGDPRSEAILRDAPADAKAVLATGGA
jgi:tetratricopeptide (TPR) repeat protein